MATKVEILIKQALRTFQKSSSSDKFNSNLSQLQKLVDDVVISDINIPKSLLSTEETQGSQFRTQKLNPIEYFEIYEDEEVTIGVFILQSGAKLPLHDHPKMFGILKVLQGVINIKSYSIVDEDTSTVISNKRNFYYQNPLKVVKQQDDLINESEGSCLLTPEDRNIHEIICVEGPASFLDVLAPPYQEEDSSHPNSCHYFKELNKIHHHGEELIRLIQIPCPHEYFFGPDSTT